MTKQELIEAVAKSSKADVSKAVMNDIVDAVFEEIVKSIKKEKRFQVPAFGTFTVKARKARIGRNPKTGESIKIKASKTIGFKPAPSVKNAL